MRVLVLGAGGFIGNHLVARLKSMQHEVVGVDLRKPLFATSLADEFITGDLRDIEFCQSVFSSAFDQVYQLAADMGGAGYLFTGENDFQVMHNSVTINTNVVRCAAEGQVGQLFYSSSACIYPKCNQIDPNNPMCREDSAYPADPDSEYGWEKLFSERLYSNAAKAGLLDVRIARFHNVYGPQNEFRTNKAKAPAAISYKVAAAKENTHVEIWGPGTQTRSFLYIDDCIDGVLALMKSSVKEPVNIGSEEIISINAFAEMAISIARKDLTIQNIPGPVGVNGRTSDNQQMLTNTGWKPKVSLKEGTAQLMHWIQEELEKEAVPPLQHL